MVPLNCIPFTVCAQSRVRTSESNKGEDGEWQCLVGLAPQQASPYSALDIEMLQKSF